MGLLPKTSGLGGLLAHSDLRYLGYVNSIKMFAIRSDRLFSYLFSFCLFFNLRNIHKYFIIMDLNRLYRPYSSSTHFRFSLSTFAEYIIVINKIA